jgi:hypothetical protein
MTFLSFRRVVSACAVVVGLAGASMFTPALRAQLSQGDLNSPEATRAVLDQQVGKRARLKLVSGQDLEGQVSRVGSQAVYLTELTGMEFSDATVRLDQVAAIIVRRPR